jgi:hypothetical protein
LTGTVMQVGRRGFIHSEQSGDRPGAVMRRDDAIDPLEQAQTLQILVGAGIKTREEARADLGLGPTAGGASGKAPVADDNATTGLGKAPPTGLRKFNPYHDERGHASTPPDTPAGGTPLSAKIVSSASMKAGFTSSQP